MFSKLFKRKDDAGVSVRNSTNGSDNALASTTPKLNEQSPSLSEVVEGNSEADWDAWNEAVTIQESQFDGLREVEEFNSTFMDSEVIETQAAATISGELLESKKPESGYDGVILEIAAEEQDRLRALKYPKSKPAAVNDAQLKPGEVDSWWGGAGKKLQD